MRTLATIVFVSAVLTGPAKSQSIDECTSLHPRSDVKLVSGCISIVARMVDELNYLVNRRFESDIKQLQFMITETQTSEMPAGAVVAFDIATGCPEGWTPFPDAAGRTIIGVGTGGGASGATLTNRSFREIGGSEQHALTIDEMPEHRHTAPWLASRGKEGEIGWGGDRGLLGKTVQSGTSGRSRPHNIMQPFIVLQYCKKENQTLRR